jgi:hypothetical protein
MDRNIAADIAKVLVVAGAVAAGQDHVMVERVAQNALENNNKKHPDKDDKGKEEAGENNEEKIDRDDCCDLPKPDLRDLNQLELARYGTEEEFTHIIARRERPEGPLTPRILRKYQSLHFKTKLGDNGHFIPGQLRQERLATMTEKQFIEMHVNKAIQQHGQLTPELLKEAVRIGKKQYQFVQGQGFNQVIGGGLGLVAGFAGRGLPVVQKGNVNALPKASPVPANMNIKGGQAPQQIGKVNLKALDLAELKHAPANMVGERQFLQHDKIAAIGGKAVHVGHGDVMKATPGLKPAAVAKSGSKPAPRANNTAAPKTKQEGATPQKTAPPAAATISQTKTAVVEKKAPAAVKKTEQKGATPQKAAPPAATAKSQVKSVNQNPSRPAVDTQKPTPAAVKKTEQRGTGGKQGKEGTLQKKEVSHSERPDIGEYRDTKGHHVYSKKAFEGHVNYDPKKGFSISEGFMKKNGISHKKVTTSQQKLFTELSKSGKPNTLKEPQFWISAKKYGRLSPFLERSNNKKGA